MPKMNGKQLCPKVSGMVTCSREMLRCSRAIASSWVTRVTALDGEDRLDDEYDGDVALGAVLLERTACFPLMNLRSLP